MCFAMVKFPAHLLQDKLVRLAEADRGLSKGIRMGEKRAENRYPCRGKVFVPRNDGGTTGRVGNFGLEIFDWKKVYTLLVKDSIRVSKKKRIGGLAIGDCRVRIVDWMRIAGAGRLANTRIGKGVLRMQ